LEKRFKVLRIVGTIYKILAWITLILGTLSGLGMLGVSLLMGMRMARQLPRLYTFAPQAGMVGGIVGAIAILLLAILYSLFLYAAGEFIYLALAIEENTRETALYLRGKEEPLESLHN